MNTDLITEHLDLWTSAVTYNNGKGRGNNGKPELTGIQKLRELILDLAVRGKLVPQDPNDEPASKLLERIEEEKAQLYKEGKIKKPKKLSKIAEGEKPFDLPDGWVFVRLGDLLERLSNGLSGKQNKEGIGYPLTRIETISKGVIDIEKLGYSLDIPDSKLEDYKLLEGDILLSHINSDYHIGKTAIVPSGLEIYHGVNLLLVRVFNLVSPRYIDLFLNYLRLRGYFIGIAQHAIGQASVNQSKIRNIVVPLPPVSEHMRIVEKVDELMALCDRLEQQTSDQISAHETLVDTLLDSLTRSQDAAELADNWARLAEHFDTLFTTEHSIDRLEQTILQLAVMGRLVPQDPNDEPASKLLERIEEEKVRLYKEGKIKKPKKLPGITEEEKPFNLPKGWEWSRLEKIAQINPRNHADDSLEVGFVPMPLIGTGYKGEHSLETREWVQVKKGYTHFADGDIALAKITPCFENSKAVVFGGLTNGVGAGTTELHVARPYSELIKPYFVLFNLKSPRFIELGKFKMTGSAGQKRVPKEYFANTPIPLPPHNEQARIVEKVYELMALCDRLKPHLEEASATQHRLAESIVKQAVSEP